MSYNETDKKTLFKVGLMTIGTLTLVGVLSVFVNDRPFWWRGCQPIFIAVSDATGLKTKSPVRSLGLQIGYLRTVELSETHVKLGICVTAPVEILNETKAYVRGEGFLGDKFVELKPVRYHGDQRVRVEGAPRDVPADQSQSQNGAQPAPKDDVPSTSSGAVRPKNGSPEHMIHGEVVEDELPEDFPKEWINGASLMNFLIPSAHAEEETARQVPVGQANGNMDKIMEQADKLLTEMTDLTKGLKEGLNPQELKATIKQLNTTLQHASKVLSPEGNLNQTARRALQKLESAFDQLNQQMTKINQGQGSVGKVLNDPVYADELLKALKSLNKLLGRAGDIRFNIDVSADRIPVYDGGRGSFKLRIYPKQDRYYLIGLTIDPRGKRKVTNTVTTSGAVETRVTSEEIEEGGMLLTGMLGKVFFNRVDLAVGALHGDGALSAGLYLGPARMPDAIVFQNDIYSRGRGIALNDRINLTVRPLAMFEGLQTLYIRGGLESVRKVDGKYAYMFGAGISFDDEDIKLLFAFR